MQIWIALATANFFACLAPGQNAALVGAATARAGPTGGGMAMLGILLAELLWVAIAIYLAFGARELAGDAFVVLQVLSAGILIWFGIGAMRQVTSASLVKVHKGVAGLISDGLVIGLANPLALVFFLSVFPAFVPTGTFGADAVAFFVSAIMVSSAAGLAPYLAAGNLMRRAGHTSLLHLVSGGALMGTGGLLLLNVAI